jgi:hypothetical protein
MSKDDFERQCDMLSQAVDGVLYERLRWSRTEGPMLAHLVDLAQAALEGRSEFELTEEGSTNEIKRFVLKVHNNRIVAIAISIEGGRASLRAEEIERSRYRLTEGAAISADFAQADELWMAATLQELFSRINA